MKPADRFIEAATAPLADSNAELHLAAQHELRERIDSSQEAALLAAATRLDGRQKNRWIPGLLILMGVISLLIIGQALTQYLALKTAYEVFNMGRPSSKPAFSTSHLSSDQKLLLFGDLSRSGRSERWKALWDSRPEYPPYFANYVGHHISEYGALPPDFLENATKIDPDNGWYWALAAASEAKGNAVMTRPSPADREAGMASTWSIVDPVKHSTALDLLEQAVSKPRITSYRKVMVEQQLRLLPKRTDYLSQFSVYSWLNDNISFGGSLRPVSELIAAEAERCKTEGDLEGYRKVQSSHKALSMVWVQDSPYLVDALVSKVYSIAPVRNLRDAASALALAGEAEVYQEIDDRLNPGVRKRRKQSDLAHDLERLAQRKGGALSAMSLPMISRQSFQPVPFREDEITPARRAEHALFGRAASLATWLLLGLSLAAISLIRPQAQLGPLSRRLRNLFLPADWAWIIGLGLMFPVLWHLLVAQFSPLAAHHWNMSFSAFILPGVQFGATALMMIITPLVVIRWRMKVRMPFIQFHHPNRWLAWLAVVSATLAIPVLGALPYIESAELLFLSLTALFLGFPLLWLIGVAFKSIYRSRHRALASRVIVDSLIPTYCIGMILSLLSVPLFHIAEKQWMRHDHIGEISSEEASFSRYEYRVTEQLKAELLEELSELP
ncbi:hypothetical protein ACFQY0_10295 [Haloferula chungangensis]|uniref:Uncharacterized protein n=1 Tax=Haloferula chungangensis TaxID=1048331 RepID=A0ABW2L5H3_9BACT